MTYSEVIRQLDVQIEHLLSTRSVFPYTGRGAIGSTRLTTAPLYKKFAHDVSFVFPEPLTAADVAKINEIGHWHNQNFIVRLYAVLNQFKIVSKTADIHRRLEGHEEVDILRRLRNEIVHTSGLYDPTDSNKKKLYDRIVRHFSLNAENHPEADGKYPIPIDKVLLPLAQGCIRYVQALSVSQDQT